MDSLVIAIVETANAIARPVAFALHITFAATYLSHLYWHRAAWAKDKRWALELFFFPLKGGNRSAVFQVFAWGLSVLGLGLSLPIYLSLLVATGEECKAGSGSLRIPDGLLRLLGSALQRPITRTHLDAASGAAVVSSLCGEFFLVKALLVFESGSTVRARAQRSRTSGNVGCDEGLAPVANGNASGSKAHTEERQQLLAPHLASLLVCLMGMALAVTGCVLLLAVEHMPDTACRVLYCCLALSCVVIGASSTHGLGGHLAYCAGAAGSAGAAVLRASAGGAGPGGASGSSGGDEGTAVEAGDAGEGPTWRFFQPFQGGSVFIATQAIGWTLFSSTVVAVLLLAKQLVAGVGYCLRCWALAAGALMMATQLVLGASILTFQQRKRARRLLQPVLHHPRASLARAAGLVMPVVMMYLPLHISLAAMASLFVLLPPQPAAAVLLAVLLPYFFTTLRGYPAHSGCRRWEWLCGWFSREVEGSLAWWAGHLRVIRDFEGTAHQAADRAQAQAEADEATAPAPPDTESSACGFAPGAPERDDAAHDANGGAAALAAAAAGGEGAGEGAAAGCGRRYVLGFHPHGLYPTGAGFLPLMPSVQRLFPGTTIVTLTASIVHYAPGIRDIAAWAGFRQVTRATFRLALREAGAVLLCPGGQAELIYADRAFPRRVAAQPPPPPPTTALPPPPPLPSAASAPAHAAPGAPASALPEAAAATTPAAPSAPGAEADGRQEDGLVAKGHGREGREGGRSPSQGRGRGGLSPPLLPTPCPPRPQLVIYAGHQGFVRLALEEGAWLVPVLALGETLQLRNLISAPAMQRSTYKWLGFPVPFILAGRWGITQLPLRNPLIYAIGAPLAPPPGWQAAREAQLRAAAAAAAAEPPPSQPSRCASEVTSAGLQRRPRSGRAAAAKPQPAAAEGGGGGGEAAATGGPQGSGHGLVVEVPQDVVDAYHAAFYTALVGLWERHHHLHPVLRHAELVFEWGRHAPPPGFPYPHAQPL